MRKRRHYQCQRHSKAQHETDQTDLSQITDHGADKIRFTRTVNSLPDRVTFSRNQSINRQAGKIILLALLEKLKPKPHLPAIALTGSPNDF